MVDCPFVQAPAMYICMVIRVLSDQVGPLANQGVGAARRDTTNGQRIVTAPAHPCRRASYHVLTVSIPCGPG